MDITGNNQKSEKYFNNGGRKYDFQDFLGAIADYTRALELNPKLAEAYKNRGLAKAYLEDFVGAIG
jgi:tetratricopeptide (TPR) repeat protein